MPLHSSGHPRKPTQLTFDQLEGRDMLSSSGVSLALPGLPTGPALAEVRTAEDSTPEHAAIATAQAVSALASGWRDLRPQFQGDYEDLLRRITMERVDVAWRRNRETVDRLEIAQDNDTIAFRGTVRYRWHLLWKGDYRNFHVSCEVRVSDLQRTAAQSGFYGGIDGVLNELVRAYGSKVSVSGARGGYPDDKVKREVLWHILAYGRRMTSNTFGAESIITASHRPEQLVSRVETVRGRVLPGQWPVVLVRPLVDAVAVPMPYWVQPVVKSVADNGAFTLNKVYFGEDNPAYTPPGTRFELVIMQVPDREIAESFREAIRISVADFPSYLYFPSMSTIVVRK